MVNHVTQSRPSIAEINQVLSESNGLIVHFSGAPKGLSFTQTIRYFPDDLNFVAAGNAQGGVSCSVVFPGDVFAGIERNAIGCVGLVLGLRTPESLVAVSATDCGTNVGPDGHRVPRQPHISIDEIRSSINGRPPRNYNEWVLADFNVLGVFAIEPLEIWGQGRIDVSDEVRELLASSQYDALDELQYGIINTSFEEIAEHFPSLPLYTFRRGRICKLVRPHSIYPV